MLAENLNIDMSRRVPQIANDELHIYKARIYDNCKKGDDRIQVRIIPYMADVPDDELENLPKYPPFFKGQVIRGQCEKDDGPTSATLCWVAATSDFTLGYVLGTANFFGGPKDKMLESWNYGETKKALQRTGTITDDFDYKNIALNMRNPNSTYIEFYSISTGEKWMMTSTGDIITIQNNKIQLTASEGVDSSSARSSIVIEPTKITFNTATFFVNAKKVVLGKHNHNALGTISSTGVSCDGVNLQPIDNIWV